MDPDERAAFCRAGCVKPLVAPGLADQPRDALPGHHQPQKDCHENTVKHHGDPPATDGAAMCNRAAIAQGASRMSGWAKNGKRAWTMTDAFTAPGRFFRGNLHTHSTRSDGVLDPGEVCRRYRDEG